MSDNFSIKPWPSAGHSLGGSPDSGVGLCLSGGGYRAMLFHVGALRRLNEAGRLASLTRVTSVSGGSLVAGLLGLRWTQLNFDRGESSPTGQLGEPVASRLTELVDEPIIRLAGKGIDVRAVLTGVRPGRISQKVQRLYDRHLFHGATLQDLPSDEMGPRFIILATNLSNGTLWRFSRPYMRDWRSEPIESPTVSMAQAVAASSAFPPVLSPCVLTLAGRSELVLSDGGIYDNLGLEPVMKRCRTIFVSDGGGSFKETNSPHRDWLLGTVRVLHTVDVQVRRLRRRQIVGALQAGTRQGAFWAIGIQPTRYPGAAKSLPVPSERVAALANIPTRLAKLDLMVRYQLINFGYAITDAALRTYVDHQLPEPSSFPYPGGVG